MRIVLRARRVYLCVQNLRWLCQRGGISLPQFSAIFAAAAPLSTHNTARGERLPLQPFIFFTTAEPSSIRDMERRIGGRTCGPKGPWFS